MAAGGKPDGDGLHDADEWNLLKSVIPSATFSHDADGDGYSDRSGSIHTSW